MNPFQEKMDNEQDDAELIRRISEGDRVALENLILRHQAWIYNIAFRMALNRSDAEDVTQEVLVKIVTKLSSYDSSQAGFRTWLYRIVANHVINMKKSRYEQAITGFEDYGEALDRIEDRELEGFPDARLLVEEGKIGCIAGMLLCLNRKHRLAYILGEIFEADDRIGGEIMETTPANFRQMLSRARRKLYGFMNGQCGLVNGGNHCRCALKAEGFIEQGWIHPNEIVFYEGQSRKVREIIEEKKERLQKDYYESYLELFREAPFYSASRVGEWLSNVIKSDDFKQLFHIE